MTLHPALTTIMWVMSTMLGQMRVSLSTIGESTYTWATIQRRSGLKAGGKQTSRQLS
jgi:hypothetical protein